MNRNKLIAKLHILLNQTGSAEFKAEIYAGYGVTSSTQMTDGQLSELIYRLENGRIVYSGGRQHGKSRRQLQSQVLAVLNRLGFREDLTKTNPAERWAELNEFVRYRNKDRKTLPEMDADELKNLFRALKRIEDSGWRKREEKPREASVVIPVPFNPRGPVN